MSKITTALVIGGGVAGPVAAMALRRAGIDAAVYEAYPTTADGVGGSLAIAPNGLAALGTIGAEDAVLAVARPISRMAMAVGTRRFLTQPGLPGLPPLQLLWRADLHRALHDRAVAQGIPITHGKRLVDAEETASGITARFADRQPRPRRRAHRRRRHPLQGPDADRPSTRPARTTPACWASRPSPPTRRQQRPTPSLLSSANAATTCTGRGLAAGPSGAPTCPRTVP